MVVENRRALGVSERKAPLPSMVEADEPRIT